MDIQHLLTQLNTTRNAIQQETQSTNATSTSQKAPDSDANTSISTTQNETQSDPLTSVITTLIKSLLDNKNNAKVAESAIKVGQFVTLGFIAYKVYSTWKSSRSEKTDTASESSTESEPSSTPTSSLLTEKDSDKVLLKAIISAAKADGYLSAEKQTFIEQTVAGMKLGGNVEQFLHQEFNKAISLTTLASQVGEDKALAKEVYLASMVTIGEPNFMETAYLNELAKQLNLSTAEIERFQQDSFPFAMNIKSKTEGTADTPTDVQMNTQKEPKKKSAHHSEKETTNTVKEPNISK
ncbi:tellurite resistance TerB family protein [Vibrio sp.]|nr:tellurite resistance TerB family protein [Vibrio sp.]